MSFPVFYAGLIEGRTNRKKRVVLNLLLNGCDDVYSDFATIDEFAAPKYVTGAISIPAYYCETYLALPEEERSLIQDLKQMRLFLKQINSLCS